MAQTNQIRITKEEFERFNPQYPSNIVVVEMDSGKEIKTQAGIILNFNPDTLYAEGDESHIADNAPVHGRIIKQVNRLYFNPKDTEFTMSWETEVETQIGDTVWSHPLATKNCDEVLVGDKIYKCLRYEDLFVAKRGDEVVPLNGHVILELVKEEQLSRFDVLDKSVDKTRGIVAYVGKPNLRYQNPAKADILSLQAGDLVVIDNRTYVYYLERSKWNAHFDGDKQFLCVQGVDIEFVLSGR